MNYSLIFIDQNFEKKMVYKLKNQKLYLEGALLGLASL